MQTNRDPEPDYNLIQNNKFVNQKTLSVPHFKKCGLFGFLD